MFNNIGKKLKNLAVVYFLLVAVICIICAFIFGFRKEQVEVRVKDNIFGYVTQIQEKSQFQAGRFFGILIGGISSGYVTSMLLYAFGELVDSSLETKKNSEESLGILKGIHRETVSGLSKTAIPHQQENAVQPQKTADQQSIPVQQQNAYDQQNNNTSARYSVIMSASGDPSSAGITLFINAGSAEAAVEEAKKKYPSLWVANVTQVDW